MTHFFFQAEDGIRDFCLSRGLGDVYKRQVIYSGDADGAVPAIGSMRWLRNLRVQNDLRVKKPWQSWLKPGKQENEPQIAGFFEEYDRDVSFVTIRGASHMVPQTHPQEALQLLSYFLNQRNLNNSPCTLR
eukprot:TRINITY_DN2079_c0_g1_i3.p1 TRINITY_DN2079_c0_g1~~TRINITY_DN2079_c0_g1_i3.p1  ORF type:complete len:131 (-),score=21.07 TRINITY_DN2079_c0_g1_i3:7-399(-)